MRDSDDPIFRHGLLLQALDRGGQALPGSFASILCAYLGSGGAVLCTDGSRINSKADADINRASRQAGPCVQRVPLFSFKHREYSHD